MRPLIGVICYMPDTVQNMDARMKAHATQLEWLKSWMKPDDVLHRVESAWTPGFDYSAINPEGLNIDHIQVPAAYPGGNRNVLLDLLYNSDADWLICMDDDRMLYPHYAGESFFDDLQSPTGIEFAKNGTMIKILLPIMQPFRKTNSAYPFKKESWWIEKVTPNGNLQICCIPNLVKYGRKPIYFNAETSCQLGDPPEDLSFEIDWVSAKNGLARNNMLIMKEIGGGENSSLYSGKEHRHEVEAAHKPWLVQYLKGKFPRNPALWSKTELSKRRNTYVEQRFPRSTPWDDAWDAK